MDYINADRINLGLKPLKMSTYYHELAEVRAYECSVEFSHTRPNGESWFSVIEESGKTFLRTCAGENLVKNFDQVLAAYQGLYNSQGHYDNMMDPDFVEVAIAIYWDENGVGYSAHLFFGETIS